VASVNTTPRPCAIFMEEPPRVPDPRTPPGKEVDDIMEEDDGEGVPSSAERPAEDHETAGATGVVEESLVYHRVHASVPEHGEGDLAEDEDAVQRPNVPGRLVLSFLRRTAVRSLARWCGSGALVGVRRPHCCASGCLGRCDLCVG